MQNQYLWPEYPPIIVVEVVSLPMVAKMGKIFLFVDQQKIRNFEKTATKLGQNVIHEDSIVNVSFINGRPTQAFNFKLTLAILALRVCKPKGGQCMVTCLGAKEFSWPKELSGGPNVTKKTSGLDKARPVALVTSKSKGILVKPNPIQVSSAALCT